MMRFGRIVRVALILFIALTAGWIGAIALVYVLYDVDSRREIASAHRVAALVEVMEQASPATRARLVSAAGSPVLDVSVIPGLAVNTATAGSRGADQDVVAVYAAALGDRPFAFGKPTSESALQRRFPRLA